MSGSQGKSWGSKFSFCLWGRMIEITGARYSVKNARICDFHATTLVAVEWQTDCDQCVHLHGHNTSPTTSHTCRSLPSRVFPLPCQNPLPWFFFADSDNSYFTNSLNTVILQRASSYFILMTILRKNPFQTYP